MSDRYYVQPLTDQIFLVRERKSEESEPGPDDKMIRSFSVRHDAYSYVNTINNEQRKLDEHYGHWVQQAIETRP